MTTATTSKRTFTQHRFEVPAPEPHGAVHSDLDVALHWAMLKAKELDINTSYDDWCRIHVEDTRIVIIVTEEHTDG